MIATRLWLRAKKYAGGLGLDDVSLNRQGIEALLMVIVLPDLCMAFSHLVHLVIDCWQREVHDLSAHVGCAF